MLNGATQIIAAVPGTNLDPMFLAKSQAENTQGFIMIAYTLAPELDSSSAATCIASPRKFYDILFFRGSKIFDCARLKQDVRFTANVDTALQTFHENQHNPSTTIFLFQVTDEIIQRFRSTFYYEHCLKIEIGALTKKQITALLKSCHCRHAIIECNEFIGAAPAVHLTEVRSEEELVRYQPVLKHGRLILYDIEKNKEKIHEGYNTHSNLQNLRSSNKFEDGLRKLDQNIAELTPEPPRRDFRLSAGVPSDKAMGDSIGAPTRAEADEFTQFIQQILNSPMSNQENQSAEAQPPARASVVVRVHDQIEPALQGIESPVPSVEEGSAVEDPAPQAPNGKPLPPKIKSPPTPVANAAKAHEHSRRRRRGLSADSPEANQKVNQEHSEFVIIFERLFRSFRQRVFECFGAQCEDVILRGEKKLRFLSPEFDCHALTDDSAATILELVEEIIKQASFMKRKKLRQAAITLISDIYNKQFNLLEQHRAIDKVEQVFYRLKK